MPTGTLSIHSENILPIIKRWLYSEKDIFLRELISNSLDAIQKLKILQAQGIFQESTSYAIHITIDPIKKRVTISDNGIGMSSIEVEKYIAQIAFSGAEDFLQKYQTTNEKDQIIGHFGLGFYSSFMVSDTVEIQTKSYQKEEKGVFWSSSGGSTYTLEEGVRQERGTDIILHLSSESLEYLEISKLREMIRRYFLFSPIPIHLNGTQINTEEPLWMKSPKDCTDKEYHNLYHQLYPMEKDPIFWVHLNIDYPFHLQGILYFAPIEQSYIQKKGIQLYCNRVFVSDNCSDFLPEHLLLLKGIIDSPDIPLNVSRSSLQVDKTVRQLSLHISKKITDRLTQLHEANADTFFTSWKDIEVLIKWGILQEEKFYDRAKDLLFWKTTKEVWTTIEKHLEKSQEKKIFYTHLDKSNLLSLYENKEVFFAHPYLDIPIFAYLEKKQEISFQRVDGDISTFIDTSKEKSLLDTEGKSEQSRIEEFFRKALSMEVEARSLTSEEMPSLVIFPEEERRYRDYMRVSDKEGSLVRSRFIVNTNHKLVMNIFLMSKKEPVFAEELAKQLYATTLLSQKEFDLFKPEEFTKSSFKTLEKLTSML
ncbi:MAG: molecular chaperone HtpG [Chlamydiota bacterium]